MKKRKRKEPTVVKIIRFGPIFILNNPYQILQIRDHKWDPFVLFGARFSIDFLAEF